MELFASDASPLLVAYMSLKLDYAQVSRACLKLGRPMSAVLYSELCGDGGHATIPALPALGGRGPVPLASMLECVDRVSAHQDALLSAHCSLNDPDGPSGLSLDASRAITRVRVAQHACDPVAALVLASAIPPPAGPRSRVRSVAVVAAAPLCVYVGVYLQVTGLQACSNEHTAWALQSLGAYPALFGYLSSNLPADLGRDGGLAQERLCEVGTDVAPGFVVERRVCVCVPSGGVEVWLVGDPGHTWGPCDRGFRWRPSHAPSSTFGCVVTV